MRSEEGLVPVWRLPVGVDARVPLHRPVLLAGLASFSRRGARRRCHGASCRPQQVKACHGRRTPWARRRAASEAAERYGAPGRTDGETGSGPSPAGQRPAAGAPAAERGRPALKRQRTSSEGPRGEAGSSASGRASCGPQFRATFLLSRRRCSLGAPSHRTTPACPA